MQPKNELILTTDGFKDISDVSDNIVLNGDSYIVKGLSKSYGMVLNKIRLMNGIEARIPKNQQILTSKGGVLAENLNYGDKVLVDYNRVPSYDFNVSDIYSYNKGILLGCMIDRRSIINKELIRLKIDNKFNDLRIILQNTVKSYDEEFKMNEGSDYLVGEITDPSKIKHLYLDTQYDKFNLTKLNKNTKLGLLRSYFTINGLIIDNGIVLVNLTDRSVLKSIQLLLMEFGIYSEVDLYKKGENITQLDGSVKLTKNIYRITVYDEIFKMIGFLDYKMNKRLSELKSFNPPLIKRKKKEQEVISIESDGSELVYRMDIKGVSHYNTNGFIVLNENKR